MGDERPENVRFLTGFSVGSRIAGYRLEEQIGQGGMAVVFRAQDERFHRQVALKVLAPALRRTRHSGTISLANPGLQR